MKKYYIFFNLLFFFAFTFGQSKDIDEIAIQKIENYLNLASQMGFNGQVIIAQGSNVLLNHSYGYSSDFSNQPVNKHTIFGIASISKQFTAAAIASLKEKGKLSYTTRLDEIFPNIPKDKAIITIHDLLTHSSGLTGMDIVDDFEDLDKAGLMKKIWDSPLELKPGEKWRYSNAGYNVLAMIIEKLSNTTYESFLQNQFFKPLKMKHSGVIGGKIKPLQPDNAVSAQRGLIDNGNVGKWSFNIRTFGGGNIYSTTSDLFKWKKELDKGKILKPKTISELQSPQFKISEDESYGYGWFVYKKELEGNVIEHGGDTYLGYNGGFYTYPDSDLTLILLNNKYEDVAAHLWMRWAVFYPIRDILFKNKNQVFPKASINKNSSKNVVDGDYQNSKYSFKINQLSNGRIFLKPKDYITTSLLTNLPDSLKTNVKSVVDKTNLLLGKLKLKDDSGYKDVLVEIFDEWGQDFINEWHEIVENKGALKEYKILAVLPDYFDKTMRSYVKLSMEQGDYYMVYRFLENGKGRLSSTFPMPEFQYGLWFLKEKDKLIHYDLWTNEETSLTLSKDKIQLTDKTIFKKIN